MFLKNIQGGLLAEREGGHPKYGDALILEEYLPGEEVTITVMPPGRYLFPSTATEGDKHEEREYNEYWALPAVGRFNHHDGVAPYNGVVAVTQNSKLLRWTPPHSIFIEACVLIFIYKCIH